MNKTITLMVALLIVLSAQAQKVNLGLNLTVGETYMQNSTAQITIKQKVQGMDVDMTMNVIGVMSFKVLSQDGDNYVIEVRYDNLEMTMTMPTGMEMKMGSGEPDENNPLAGLMSGMLDKPFEIRMAKNGKTTDVKGVEEIFEGAFDNVGLPAAQLEQLKAQIKKSYGADAFKGNMDAALAIYPDKKVKVGKSWEVITTTNSGMVYTVTNKYTLKSIESDGYMISGDGSMQTDNTSEMDVNGMKMKYNLSGNVTATIKVDKVSGWITESKIKQNFSGVNELLDSPQIPGGLKIPMDMITDMVISN